MERALFLIERTGERVSCMLNPEHVIMRRLSGVRPRRSSGGKLSGQSGHQDPLLFTGGGRTELEVDLLFDVHLDGTTMQSEDVRDLTRPLWSLTEGTGHSGQPAVPPRLLFVWGKSWNLPAVAVSISERLERFTGGGVPQRSWVRMKLLRIQPMPEDEATAGVNDLGTPRGGAIDAQLARPDLDAFQATGDPSRWREFVADSAGILTGGGV